jgi:hypothetical protein
VFHPRAKAMRSSAVPVTLATPMSFDDEITSQARAALRRLAWELCDDRISREGEALVLVRDAANRRALWLEVREERLHLADHRHSVELASDTTSRQVRALAAEWRACGGRLNE